MQVNISFAVTMSLTLFLPLQPAVDSYKQQIRMFLHMHSRRNQQLMMLMTKKSEDEENNHNKRSLSNPRPSEKMNGNKLCAGEV